MSIRKTLFLLFLILSVHCVFAQDTIVRKRFVEYYVGGNRSDISNTYQFKNDYVNPKFVVNVGLFYERNISKSFQIGTGLCYLLAKKPNIEPEMERLVPVLSATLHENEAVYSIICSPA